MQDSPDDEERLGGSCGFLEDKGLFATLTFLVGLGDELGDLLCGLQDILVRALMNCIQIVDDCHMSYYVPIFAFLLYDQSVGALRSNAGRPSTDCKSPVGTSYLLNMTRERQKVRDLAIDIARQWPLEARS